MTSTKQTNAEPQVISDISTPQTDSIKIQNDSRKCYYKL